MALIQSAVSMHGSVIALTAMPLHSSETSCHSPAIVYPRTLQTVHQHSRVVGQVDIEHLCVPLITECQRYGILHRVLGGTGRETGRLTHN